MQRDELIGTRAPTADELTRGRRRFELALREVGATQHGADLFAQLVARYQEPHRHYHTLAHIDACLARLDRFGQSAERRAEVELTLWFHDAVYDPRASDNERASARLASDRLRELGVPAESIGRIAQYIDATAQHRAGSGDSALVNDLDLGILAAEREAFDRFEAQVRKEYAHVLEAMFRIGRGHVLSGLLERESIYNVSDLRDAFEARARANLARRLRELSG